MGNTLVNFFHMTLSAYDGRQYCNLIGNDHSLYP